MRIRRSRGRARRVSVAVSVTCIALAAMVAPAQASEPLAPARPIKLGTAPAGYTMNRPSVLMTSKDATLITWREYQKDPNRIRLVRKAKGAKHFARVAIPSGPLTEFGEPRLTEDKVNNRIILSAFGQSDGAANLGLYVWISKNQGASWSQPKRVWDRFATGQIALDKHGGFYAVTDTTGVSVTHVPKNLDPQVWPDDDIVLSDRIASRAAVGVATTGPAADLLFLFTTANHRAFLHHTLEPGAERDGTVMMNLAGDGDAQIVADSRAALVAGLAERQTPTGLTWSLQGEVVTMSAAHGQASTPQHPIAPMKDDVAWFAINTVAGPSDQATGRFEAVWITADGRLRSAHSTKPGLAAIGSWTDPKTLLKFPTQGGYQFAGPLANDGPWVAVHAHTRNLTEVQLAIPN